MKTFSQNFDKFSRDYSRIEQAIIFIEKNFKKQPTLKEIAESVYLSEYHFNRLFKRWAGISPKKFLEFLTIEYAKDLLNKSKSLLDVTYESGLSSTGRLHDLFTNIEAVTPGEFKNKGAGLKISYGIHSTPFGKCILAVTDKGICGLEFISQNYYEKTIKRLKNKWKEADLIENTELTQNFVNKVFLFNSKDKTEQLNLFLKGTNFQIKVWSALLKIPYGFIVSYEDIANFIGEPTASRAVGNAVAQNPIAYIIPCHRVIKKVGIIGNYRWGSARKKAILGFETANKDFPSFKNLENL
jgi:AraC family transcriptional regulator of adaptative response/methylated-DNA-[protein]-cysteine methyltransferase